MTKQINKVLYIPLTALNIWGGVYYVGIENWALILIMVVAFIINQLMLITGMELLIDENGNKRISIFLLITKLFLIAGIFWYAMQKHEDFIYIFVGNYIIQLIILVLSIKSYDKEKIEESL